MNRSTFTAYIVQCADGSFYCGWTNDLEARIAAHNSGRGSRYTRARLPVVLRAQWNFSSKREAMRFEWRLKQLTRQEKLALVGDDGDVSDHRREGLLAKLHG